MDRTLELHSDQAIVLIGKKSKVAYPEVPRRVSRAHLDSNKRFFHLTNVFSGSAKTVADIYKQRRHDLFFRWNKLNLRIKTSYGTSPSAAKTEIWIAVSIYILATILRKRLCLPLSLHTILQVLEVKIIAKRPAIHIVKNVYKQKSEVTLYNY